MPLGNKSQGVYWVISGKRYSSGCCFDYGNAETNNSASAVGTMASIYFGTCHYWAVGAGNGPWMMIDPEGGLLPGGAVAALGGPHYTKNPSITYDYVSGIVKTASTPSPRYSLKFGNAQSGNLTTIYDSAFGSTWKLLGGIILGIGGDNGNKGLGTFFEGAITYGRPEDSVDEAIQRNIVAAYGNTGTDGPGEKDEPPVFPFNVRYNPSTARAVISYTLKNARRVCISIFEPQGKHIATVVNGQKPPGRHEVVWDAKCFPAGIYVYRIAIDGRAGETGRFAIGK